MDDVIFILPSRYDMNIQMFVVKQKNNMSHHCSCNSEGSSFEIIDVDALLVSFDGLRSEEYATRNIFISEGRKIAAVGTVKGDKGCAVFPIFGVPAEICWDIEKLEIDLPNIEVVVSLKIKVAGMEAMRVKLTMKCDVTRSESCLFEVDREFTSESFGKDCNWKCLVKCAPGCASCGVNYWCWAGCAIVCVGKCCL